MPLSGRGVRGMPCAPINYVTARSGPALPGAAVSSSAYPELAFVILRPDNFVRLILFRVDSDRDDGLVEQLVRAERTDDKLLRGPAVVRVEKDIHTSAADVSTVAKTD